MTADQEFREALADALSSDFRVVVPPDRQDPESTRPPGADILHYELDTNGSGARGALELLENLGANESDTAVIVLSDDPRPQTALHILNAGVYDYFQKPVNTAALRVIMKRAVEKLRIERENRLLERK